MQQSGDVFHSAGLSLQNMYKDITTSFMPSLSQCKNSKINSYLYLLTLVTEIEKV